jgi:hypothetical protein
MVSWTDVNSTPIPGINTINPWHNFKTGKRAARAFENPARVSFLKGWGLFPGVEYLFSSVADGYLGR